MRVTPEEFSKRYLHRPGLGLQVTSMDERLRAALFNAVHDYLLAPFKASGQQYGSEFYKPLAEFFSRMWGDAIRKPLCSFSPVYDRVEETVHRHFMLQEWWAVYDLLEWIALNFPRGFPVSVSEFIALCNSELERESSAYRFVGRLITPITNNLEIDAVNAAQLTTQERNLKGIWEHLQTAQRHLSDRHSPDYRNCIKESVSAVEGTANAINGSKGSTLGPALAAIEKSGAIELHPALKKAICQIYGYSSDHDGIRHFLIEDKSTSDLADAKFMLVSCSALVNFLIQKADQAGVSLGSK